MRKLHLSFNTIKLVLAVIALLAIVEVTTNWEAHKNAFWEGYEAVKTESSEQTEQQTQNIDIKNKKHS